MSIPKTIHYCWFGGKKKSQLVKDCIDSWRTLMPDYKIIEWNESNTELENEFVLEAYKRKKWAFVADYIRFKILYDYGGIYLDTDMFVIKKLDDFLMDKCFLGAEVHEFINGAILGAEKKHPFINSCMQEYNKLKLVSDEDLITITLPKIITSNFNKLYSFNGVFDNNKEFGDIKLYSIEYFYPFPYRNHNEKFNIESISKYCTPKTYAIHLWSGSWKEFTEFQLIVKRKYFKAFKKIVVSIIDKKGVSKKYIKELKLSLKESLL